MPNRVVIDESIIDKKFINDNLLTVKGSLNNQRVRWLDISNEELYLLYNDAKPHICDNCGVNTTKFQSFTKGYLKYCSTKCSRTSEETLKKSIKTKILNGTYSESERSEYKRYRQRVNALTRKQDVTTLPYYNMRSSSKDGYHLDHKISIKYGFINAIPAEIISCIYNLEFIPGGDNERKGSKISMTSESLYNLYHSNYRNTIDTNILIDTPNIIAELISKDVLPVISFITLSELDNLKRNPDLKRAAQTAIKNIYYDISNIAIIDIPTQKKTNDELIIESARKTDSKLMTNDIGARAIAITNGVDVIDALDDESINYDYTGYRIVKGDLNYEQDIVQIKELMYEEAVAKFDVHLKENEYLIVDRLIDKEDIWVKKGNKVFRITQSMKQYKDAGVVDTPLDSIQMAALDAVFDPSVPLTVIDGKLGTGKTMLTLMAALSCTNGQRRYQFYEKILVTRPPVSTNKNLQVGFLPGSLEEKLGDWMGGIKSNLKFLLEKTEKDKREEKASEAFEKYFDMINIDSIQGTSLHNTILLVDEYQLLDVDTLKLVLSRISEGSKVVLIGDTQNQTYGVNKANEGFKVLYKHLGSAPEFNYIKLANIYRSKLASFISGIFDD